ncbi:Macro domain, partial [Trinorchestia longiramus]
KYAKYESYFIQKSIEKCGNLPVLPEEFVPDAELNSKVSLFIGDITALEIDCIVNAANSSLLGGGGVDGAIHRAAGGGLLKECRTLRGCATGEAKITYGFKLPAKHVIHTVGPMTTDRRALSSCYMNSMEIAMEKKLRSIAFPCISTGIYGFPNDMAAQVVISLVRKFLSMENNRAHFDRIIFCLFLQKDIDLYHYYMQQVFPL